VSGGVGEDVIIGGEGADSLDGGRDDDLYVYALGDGQDTITEDESGHDTLKLINIKSHHIHFSQAENGTDLVIRFIGDDMLPEDKITIQNQLTAPVIERLELDDNNAIDLTALNFDAQGNGVYELSAYSDAIDQAELMANFQRGFELQNSELIYNTDSTWYQDNYDLNVLNEEIDYERHNEVQIRRKTKKRSSFGGHYNVYYKYYEKNLGGTFGNDKIVGSWWAENIWGKEGNDQLFGNDGNDNLYGGNDHDVLFGGAGDDKLFGQLGTDKAYGGGDDDLILGGDQNDTLFGEWGEDIIQAGNGDDFVDGGLGGDKIYGGDGHDILLGNHGDDIIFGGRGNDLIVGGEGNDNIYADTGDDLIYAGDGNDFIESKGGNDIIVGGRGEDMFVLTHGVEGTIVLKDFDPSTEKIILKVKYSNPLTFNFVMQFARQEGEHVVIDFEEFNQSLVIEHTNVTDIKEDNFLIALTGTSGEDIIHGTENSDALFGEEGNDTLYGGNGEDYLWGGQGLDKIYGEGGNDVLFYEQDSQWQPEKVVHFFSKSFLNILRYVLASKNVPHTLNYNQSEVYGESVLSNISAENLIDLTGYGFNQDTFDGGDGTDTLILTGQSDALLLSGRSLAESYPPSTVHHSQIANFKGTIVDIEVIYGLSGDDVVNLTAPETTYGNVIVYGNQGNDVIWSNAGDDKLFGQSGEDNIDGGAGDDLISGGDDNDNMRGGAGNDLIEGGLGNDVLKGNTGDDTLIGGLGDDELQGNEGNDTLDGGQGVDRLFGGSGQDMFVFQQQSDSTDNIADFTIGEDAINLSKFEQFLTLEQLTLNQNGSNAEIVLSNDQKIVLENINKQSLSSSDFVFNLYLGDKFYQRFNQSVTYDFNQDSLIEDNSAEIDLSIQYYSADADQTILVGQSGEDNIQGDATANIIRGFEGNDTLLGDERSDIDELQQETYIETEQYVAYTGKGGIINKTREIEKTRDVHVFYQGGEDKIEGGEGDDVIKGFGAHDWLLGDSGNDSLYGGTGNDTLDGGSGDDILEGGEGHDKLFSESGQNWFHGGAGMDYIEGGNGNDVIYGGSGEDNIVGRSGDDYIDAGTNADVVEGGQGDDHIIGGLGDDRLDGNEGRDFIEGNEGDDVINGQAGNDWLEGQAGNDTLNGGMNTDKLHGGDGNDLLSGGQGADVLIGGAGNDQFYFDSLDDNSEESPDTIIDFEQGIDQINLSQLDAIFTDLTFDVHDDFTQIGIQNEDFGIKVIGQNTLAESDFLMQA